MTTTQDVVHELRRFKPHSSVLNYFSTVPANQSETIPVVGDEPPARSDSNALRAAFRRYSIVVAALLLQGCAVLEAPGDWNARDTALEATFQASNLMDAVTTARIQDTPGIIETTPFARELLGRNPGTTETAVYFGTVALSHYVIARSLPKKWRPWFQAGSIIHSSEAVIRNCDNGLC